MEVSSGQNDSSLSVSAFRPSRVEGTERILQREAHNCVPGQNLAKSFTVSKSCSRSAVICSLTMHTALRFTQTPLTLSNPLTLSPPLKHCSHTLLKACCFFLFFLGLGLIILTNKSISPKQSVNKYGGFRWGPCLSLFWAVKPQSR